MRTDDQYFKSGDKVMRTGDAPKGHASLPDTGGRPVPQFGVVYCVEDFWVGPCWNVVVFVGGGGWARNPHNGDPVGWPASAFRKVEEIKLCVAAVERIRIGHWSEDRQLLSANGRSEP